MSYVQTHAEQAQDAVQELRYDLDCIVADGVVDGEEFEVIAGIPDRLAGISSSLYCLIAACWINGQLFRVDPARVPDHNLAAKLAQVVTVLDRVELAGRPKRSLAARKRIAAKRRASARHKLAKAA